MHDINSTSTTNVNDKTSSDNVNDKSSSDSVNDKKSPNDANATSSSDNVNGKASSDDLRDKTETSVNLEGEVTEPENDQDSGDQITTNEQNEARPPQEKAFSYQEDFFTAYLV